MFWRTKEFEQFAPLFFGVLSFALIWKFRFQISCNFIPNRWDASNLYSAVFNWASIQSGFVFGIYGFIATKKDGFAGVFARGGSFTRFLAYARRAYATGFFLTFISLPIMVVDPVISDSRELEFWIVAAWFATFIWTFCAFLRVAFIFGMVTATSEQPKGIPG
jgi:hypothetical protein